MSSHTWDDVRKYFDHLNQRLNKVGRMLKVAYDDFIKKHKSPEEAMNDLKAMSKEIEKEIEAHDAQQRRA